MTALDAVLQLSLPECAGPCGLPMRRDDHRRHGGVCSTCRPRPEVSDPAVQQLADWQRTVHRIRGDERRRDNDRAARLAARRRNREGSTNARR